MARKIIVLNQVAETGDYNIAFWLDVPVSRQRFYANASATSVFLDATIEEVAAIRAGAVAEMPERVNRPNGQTIPQLRAALVARHAELQAFVDNGNPWSRYGSFYDGDAWTTVVVP